ncbi:MAG: LuxR C-terminal-related transcriptional regulator [Bacteroidales bacterium]|nr:LuxR C-terminal-related transcriptional regulator [Bacteroidales bacterium]
MKKMKLYEDDDKMIDLISDNYSMLQGLGAFGIRLGFGDKTVREVCQEQDVDSYTFLTVVNFLINGYTPNNSDERISVKTLLGYLRASHRYFLDFQLPTIRKKLEESLSKGDRLASLILRLYDEYDHDIRLHMKYEEKTLFPYVEALLRGEQKPNYNVDIFAKHHSDTTGKFQELKNIIIKYLPHDGLANNQLTTTLYDIYNNEEWLQNHSNVEEVLFVPAIRLLEQHLKTDDVSARISSMIQQAENKESISEREKDIIICLVQGMSNKEIAAQLYISVNTVITHRRNIVRKLQIHSLAGLTIYAIANGLIDSKVIYNK